jgi:hypothetical protein
MLKLGADVHPTVLGEGGKVIQPVIVRHALSENAFSRGGTFDFP